MFKKTLLALALTGLAGTATAATINTGTQASPANVATFSAEGIAQVTSVDLDTAVSDLDLNAATAGAPGVAEVSLAKFADYRVGDKLVFTFPNDKFAVGTGATLYLTTVDATTPTAITTTNALIPTTDYTLAYSNGNKVEFTLTATGAAKITGDPAGAVTAQVTAATVTLAGVNLDSANLQAGGSVAVAYNAISSITSGSFDAATAKTIATAATQLKFGASANFAKFDAVVDVSNGRTVFVGGAKSDSGKAPFVNDSGLSEAAAVSKVVYTLTSTAGFDFLDTDGDGKADYDITSTSGTVVLSSDLQSAKVQTTSLSDITFAIEATDGKTVIPTQNFTLSTDVTYTIKDAAGNNATVVKPLVTSLGGWALNGSQTVVNFIPFGSQYAQSITVTNSGNIEGEISVSMIADGKAIGPVTLDAMAKAKSVTNIGKEVAAVAAENGVTGDARLTITVDAPNSSITTDAIYYSKADKDRVKVK